MDRSACTRGRIVRGFCAYRVTNARKSIGLHSSRFSFVLLRRTITLTKKKKKKGKSFRPARVRSRKSRRREKAKKERSRYFHRSSSPFFLYSLSLFFPFARLVSAALLGSRLFPLVRRRVRGLMLILSSRPSRFFAKAISRSSRIIPRFWLYSGTRLF